MVVPLTMPRTRIDRRSRRGRRRAARGPGCRRRPRPRSATATPRPAGDRLELRAVVGDDVLVRGDDRLAGAERGGDQRPGGLVAAHELDDDVDLGMATRWAGASVSRSAGIPAARALLEVAARRRPTSSSGAPSAGVEARRRARAARRRRRARRCRRRARRRATAGGSSIGLGTGGHRRDGSRRRASAERGRRAIGPSATLGRR